jgi:hypothetical protein
MKKQIVSVMDSPNGKLITFLLIVLTTVLTLTSSVRTWLRPDPVEIIRVQPDTMVGSQFLRKIAEENMRYNEETRAMIRANTAAIKDLSEIVHKQNSR